MRTPPDESRKRRCAASRQTMPIETMIRFVVSPDGWIVPDLRCRLPGRGIWVAAERAAIERAVQRRAFEAMARRPVQVPSALASMVDRQLADHVIGFLSLARKAGCAVCGFTAVSARLNDTRLAALAIAADGSERQIDTLLRRSRVPSHIRCLTSAELGVAFGRRTVVYAGLERGGLAKRTVVEAHRLSLLRR